MSAETTPVLYIGYVSLTLVAFVLACIALFWVLRIRKKRKEICTMLTQINGILKKRVVCGDFLDRIASKYHWETVCLGPREVKGEDEEQYANLDGFEKDEMERMEDLSSEILSTLADIDDPELLKEIEGKKERLPRIRPPTKPITRISGVDPQYSTLRRTLSSVSKSTGASVGKPKEQSITSQKPIRDISLPKDKKKKKIVDVEVVETRGKPKAVVKPKAIKPEVKQKVDHKPNKSDDNLRTTRPTTLPMEAVKREDKVPSVSDSLRTSHHNVRHANRDVTDSLRTTRNPFPVNSGNVERDVTDTDSLRTNRHEFKEDELEDTEEEE